MELAIAIVAVVLSLASLAWQAYAWRTSGPQIRVTGLIRWQDELAPTLQVDVINSGRAAAQVRTVEMVGARRDFGFDPSQYRLDSSPTLPATVEAHSTLTQLFSAGAICRALDHHEALPWEAKIVAAIGDGTAVWSESIMFDKELAVDDAFAVPDHATRRTRTRSTAERRGRLGRRRRRT